MDVTSASSISSIAQANVGRSNWIRHLFLSFLQSFEQVTDNFMYSKAHIEFCKRGNNARILKLIACIDWNVRLLMKVVLLMGE